MKGNNPEKRIVFMDDIPTSFSYTVNEGEQVYFDLASFKEFHDVAIDINVLSNGSFEGAFADFSHGNGRFILNVHLLGEGAKCHWSLACLNNGFSEKHFDTSVFHEAPQTEALMSNYGIARDNGKLFFAGVSEIRPGSHKTKTRQESKIIVFDPEALGRASPVLRIGENDVEASHAAVVGRLNAAHLFYLESRGISEEEAKRLITLGYLRPIEGFFVDAKVVEEIERAIEGGI